MYLSVLDGGIESAVSSLNAAYGNQIDVKCIPLRTYEGFAKHVLGVEDETLTQPSNHKIDSDGLIFFLHFVVEYRGNCLCIAVLAVESEVSFQFAVIY